jgi:hypothetical protein
MGVHKLPKAFIPEIDERAFLRRYVTLKWPVRRCAKAAGISVGRGKAILAAHGVELRGSQPAKPIDEASLVRAYMVNNSVNICAKVLQVSDTRVRAILIAHGITLNGPQYPPDPDHSQEGWIFAKRV